MSEYTFSRAESELAARGLYLSVHTEGVETGDEDRCVRMLVLHDGNLAHAASLPGATLRGEAFSEQVRLLEKLVRAKANGADHARLCVSRPRRRDRLRRALKQAASLIWEALT